MLTVLALAMCRPLRAPQGRQEVYAIDTVPHRLALASKASSKVEVVDFQQVDVKKHIHQKEPQGLDGGLTVPFYRSHLGCCRREGQGACLAFDTFADVHVAGIDCTTFHEPGSLLHKIQKAGMLETDACDTPNEAIWLSRKFGRVGLIGVYAAFTNGFNMGAVMKKGVRFIGNGQAPVHLYWEELLNDYILAGKFDPRFMISHRVDIEDFEELYKAFDNRIAGIEKVFVRPRRGE
jgi:threonine dehydrogenase-like Zn-dependent dehydrogenase